MACLCQTWSEIPKTGFLSSWLIYALVNNPSSVSIEFPDYTGPEVIKLLMLNSAEIKICPAHKC